MENPKIILINNDCIEELKKMKNNSIDCIITDPPYFIDKLDNNWSSNKVNNDTKNRAKESARLIKKRLLEKTKKS